jgi:hypothetical protein
MRGISAWHGFCYFFAMVCFLHDFPMHEQTAYLRQTEGKVTQLVCDFDWQ